MKKQYLLMCLLALFSFSSYSQKLGYKEIQIGKTISVLLENEYKFKAFEAKNGEEGFILIVDSSFKICGHSVEYVKIWRDDEYKINIVQVVTKEVIFKDFTDYLNNTKNIATCIIGSVGKPVTVDLDKPNSQKNGFGWDFKDEGTMLGLFVDNMSSFAQNEKRRYFLTWAKTSKQKMW
ncbi:hypothetical protein WG904_16845 [Pedobacter sp. Du54]|uniref:hypothetical protein n=1 Tax=Pedobacter anseongensis TaxID=3133439 RepID=UPI00309FB3B7